MFVWRWFSLGKRAGLGGYLLHQVTLARNVGWCSGYLWMMTQVIFQVSLPIDDLEYFFSNQMVVNLFLNIPISAPERSMYLYLIFLYTKLCMCWSYGPINFDQEPHLKFSPGWFNYELGELAWITELTYPELYLWRNGYRILLYDVKCPLCVRQLIMQSVNVEMISIIVSALKYLLAHNCMWNPVFLLVYFDIFILHRWGMVLLAKNNGQLTLASCWWFISEKYLSIW